VVSAVYAYRKFAKCGAGLALHRDCCRKIHPAQEKQPAKSRLNCARLTSRMVLAACLENSPVPSTCLERSLSLWWVTGPTRHLRRSSASGVRKRRRKSLQRTRGSNARASQSASQTRLTCITQRFAEELSGEAFRERLCGKSFVLKADPKSVQQDREIIGHMAPRNCVPRPLTRLQQTLSTRSFVCVLAIEDRPRAPRAFTAVYFEWRNLVSR